MEISSKNDTFGTSFFPQEYVFLTLDTYSTSYGGGSWLQPMFSQLQGRNGLVKRTWPDKAAYFMVDGKQREQEGSGERKHPLRSFPSDPPL